MLVTKMNERIKDTESTIEFVNGTYCWPPDYIEKLIEIVIKECAYHADVFSALGCPTDMDPSETKPSDYIKRQFGIENEEI